MVNTTPIVGEPKEAETVDYDLPLTPSPDTSATVVMTHEELKKVIEGVPAEETA